MWHPPALPTSLGVRAVLIVSFSSVCSAVRPGVLAPSQIHDWDVAAPLANPPPGQEAAATACLC
jgi:hypothetical protein